MTNNNNNIQNILQNNINITPPFPYGRKEIVELKEGLNQLQELSKTKILNKSEESDLPNDSEMSSFKEAFPNFGKEKELCGVFEKIKPLSENLENSEVLTKLLEKEGLSNFLNKFKEKCSPESKEQCDSLLKDFIAKLDKMDNVLENNSLGQFGNMTINEALNQGVKIIGPLNEALKGVGVTFEGIGGFITFLLMYKSVVKTNAYLMKKYNPSQASYKNMSSIEKMNLEKIWLEHHRHFTKIAAPILVATLYIIKQVVFSPTVVVKVESPSPPDGSPFLPSLAEREAGGDLNKTNVNMNMGIFGFFKKLPNFIGKIVISLIIISLIKHLLNIYSINIMDPFYIKIFSIFGIIIISIISLDYLFKYLLYVYFSINNNLSISNKYPKILFDYLNQIKLVNDTGSKNGINYGSFFLLNLFIYLFILIILLTLLFLTL